MLTSLLLGATIMTQQFPQHVATTPVPQQNQPWWDERHKKCVDLTKKGGIDVVFLGDSITQGWEGGGKKTWDREFAQLNSGNFGFSGDRTEHVLYRLQNGEIVGLDPKLVVMMIGTNNIGHGSSTPQQTADGVRAITKTLWEKLPRAKILLLGIFPRGEQPNDQMRLKVNEATSLFKGLDDGKRVHFLDIGKFFLHQDGTLKMLLMPDALHLNENGYEIWAKAIKRQVTELLR